MEPRRANALLTAGLLLLAGCGGPKLVPVRGKVEYHGKPVVPGSVYFHPDKDNGNTGGLLASGVLQLDGSFALRTYPHGSGATAGRYKVTLSLGPGAEGGLQPYTNEAKTTIFVEVPPGGLSEFTISLPIK